MYNSPMRGISCTIRQKTLIISSATPLKVLTSAVLNPELREADTIINHQVTRDFDERSPQRYMRNIAEKLHLNPAKTVGLMTAVDVRNHVAKTLRERGIEVTAIVTGGVSNPATAGDDLTHTPVGTINIVVLTNAKLVGGSMVNAVQTATEAKTVALHALDVRSRFSKRAASGTTSDAVVVGSTQRGEATTYAGTATRLGKLIGKTVSEAVRDAITKDMEFKQRMALKKRLEEYGIRFDDLVKTWRQLYIHHPSMGKLKDVENLVAENLENALSDCNVASLVLAGLRLEEDGASGLIPGLGKTTSRDDPVSLVADELLGLAIADYLAGSRGIFEFYRFDRLKPGLLKKLGPFADDVIGGLVSGVSSSVYTQILSKRR